MTYPAAPLLASSDGRSALRASDPEREQTANLLRESCAEGRLTPGELADRLDGAYSARTRGDLAALCDDLPTGASTITAPTRPLRRRLPRHLSALPPLAGLVALATVTDAHVLWLAWPLLAIFGRRRPPHPGRRSLTASR